MAEESSRGAEDIICELIEKPFSVRTVGEQKEILQHKKPQPKLGPRTADHQFQGDWYAKKEWLCGSTNLQRLFCWPCLLFAPGKSQTWTRQGCADMLSFLSDCRKHERSNCHLEAYKKWKTFDATERVDMIFSRARREKVQRHNEQVRQNRETLKTIFEAILFLSKQELAFRCHDESNNSLTKGNYRELLECFAKFDSIFERRLHRELTEGERVHSGVFTDLYSEIQNDLIECIDSFIQDQIGKEIENCRFLSIQVNETTVVSTKEQLSVIRLDREGEVLERFLKLFDVSSDRSAVTISDGVRSILSRYGESLKEKLIMQTYDGASVMSGQIGGLQTLNR